MDAVINSIEKAIGLLQDAVRQIRQDAQSNTGSSVYDESTSQGKERRPIAWGAHVSPVFIERVWWIADTLGLNPDDLMACMAWESGESFRPDIRNMAGSGATGLIQFMPSTAVSLGTTTQKLAAMTAEDQLNFVYKYFRPYAGRLNNLGDIYMAILWPKAVGKPDSYVLWDKGAQPVTFRQNAGLDVNKDGKVTRAECLSKIQGKLSKGLLKQNIG